MQMSWLPLTSPIYPLLLYLINHALQYLIATGGLKDFELCGYDFEILKVWYRIKRSLKQQDLSQLILKVLISLSICLSISMFS